MTLVHNVHASVSIKVGGQDKLDHLIVACQLNISPVDCRHSFKWHPRL